MNEVIGLKYKIYKKLIIQISGINMANFSIMAIVTLWQDKKSLWLLQTLKQSTFNKLFHFYFNGVSF